MTAPWIVAFVALWILVLLVAIVALGVIRRAASVLEAAESRLAGGTFPLGGAPPGTLVPAFEVRDRSGAIVYSADLTQTERIFLFVSRDCEPCRPLLADLDDAGDMRDTSLVVVLGDSPQELSLTFPPELTVVHQSERAAAKAFQSLATPQAFAVAAGGTVIDSSIPQTAADVRSPARQLKGGGGRTRADVEMTVS